MAKAGMIVYDRSGWKDFVKGCAWGVFPRDNQLDMAQKQMF